MIRSAKIQYTPEERKLLTLCFTAYAVIYITRINLSIAIPTLLAEEIVSKSQAGFIVSAFFWAYASGQLFSGYLGDRIPPKRILAVGLFGTAICNLLFGVSRSMPVMILLSAANGLLQSLAWAPIVALYVGVFSGEKRTKAMFSLSYSTVCGYLLAWCGFVVIRDMYGWRSVFYLPGGIAMVFSCIWVIWFQSPISIRPVYRRSKLSFLLQNRALRVSLLILILGCVAQGLIRDSVNVWLPTMLGSIGLSSSGTMLLLMGVPVIMLAGIAVSRVVMRVNRNDYYRSMNILYAVAAVPILLAFFVERVSMIGAASLCIGLLGLLFAINPLYTSFSPIPFQKYNCVSTVAGIVDCGIYMGSSLSSVLTGFLLEFGSWRRLYWMWLVMLMLSLGLTNFLRRRSI